jgi:alkylated DNA repair dioxygenase AlkB
MAQHRSKTTRPSSHQMSMASFLKSGSKHEATLASSSSSSSSSSSPTTSWSYLLPKVQSLCNSTTIMKTIIPLTTNNSSWVLHVPSFCPPPSRQDFQEYFQQHPTNYHPIMMFGKQTYENRYSQLYVVDHGSSVAPLPTVYRYSGSSKPSIVCNPKNKETILPSEQFVVDLCRMTDHLVQYLQTNPSTTTAAAPDDGNHVNHNKTSTYVIQDDPSSSSSSSLPPPPPPPYWYNACLVNWYKPEHSIGLHSDDEASMDHMVNNFPIVSLSWGGPRRFLLRPKPKTIHALQPVTELLVQSGDLIVMGGQCQVEFKHEVPRLRKCDGIVDNRISWTIRKMKPEVTTKRKRAVTATLPPPTTPTSNNTCKKRKQRPT